MFYLTPIAVALQGIGYGTLLESLQGLVAVTVKPGVGGGGGRRYPINLFQPGEEPLPRYIYPRSIHSSEAFGIPSVHLVGRSRERRREEERTLLGIL